jgi:AraC-like DNA-binding protein
LQRWELVWAHFQPRPEWFAWLNWPVVADGLMRLRIDGSDGDAIARQFTENLSLSDIAAAAQSSVFHLARTFKARTGFSLHAYRNRLRLRAALERMRDPQVAGDVFVLDVDDQECAIPAR